MYEEFRGAMDDLISYKFVTSDQQSEGGGEHAMMGALQMHKINFNN